MANKSEPDWGFKAIKEPGLSVIDPLIRLSYAMLRNAIIDLKHSDPVTALDALLWWLQDGPIWLEMLQITDPENGDYFSRLIEGCTNGKK